MKPSPIIVPLAALDRRGFKIAVHAIDDGAPRVVITICNGAVTFEEVTAEVR